MRWQEDAAGFRAARVTALLTLCANQPQKKLLHEDPRFSLLASRSRCRLSTSENKSNKTLKSASPLLSDHSHEQTFTLIKNLLWSDSILRASHFVKKHATPQMVSQI